MQEDESRHGRDGADPRFQAIARTVMRRAHGIGHQDHECHNVHKGKIGSVLCDLCDLRELGAAAVGLLTAEPDLQTLATNALAQIDGEFTSRGAARQRRGRARPVGRAAHLRAQHRRPVLRAGLRAGAGPAVADGDVPPHVRGHAGGDHGAVVRRARPAGAAAQVPRAVRRPRVDELSPRGQAHLRRVRARRERVHRAGGKPSARRVPAHRHHAAAVDAEVALLRTQTAMPTADALPSSRSHAASRGSAPTRRTAPRGRRRSARSSCPTAWTCLGDRRGGRRRGLAGRAHGRRAARAAAAVPRAARRAAVGEPRRAGELAGQQQLGASAARSRRGARDRRERSASQRRQSVHPLHRAPATRRAGT